MWQFLTLYHILIIHGKGHSFRVQSVIQSTAYPVLVSTAYFKATVCIWRPDPPQTLRVVIRMGLLCMDEFFNPLNTELNPIC